LSAVIEMGFSNGFADMCENRKFKPVDARRASSFRAPPRGQALASLVASDLRERFYSWRGLSGQRYVFSVFSIAETAMVCEFTAAAVIGVASDGLARRPVCVMSSREFCQLESGGLRSESLAAGVSEWHVHFGVDEEGLRDLAGTLFG
jgi:hypothetical protein